jgi:hypothetical protein
MTRRALAALLAYAVCAAAACSAPLLKLPAGPGIPATDAADLLAEATRACRGVRTLSAEIGVTGTAAGRRVRGRLLVGIAAPASIRIEALAPFGPPAFIFVTTGDDATLLFPRDDRILEHGAPAEVLDAAAGVPLDAPDLFSTLTGCAPALPPASARELGADWRSVHMSDAAAGYDMFLHREAATAPWRLVATLREGAAAGAWRAEYRDFQNDLPRSIRIAGTGPFGGPKAPAFDLRLALSQLEINVPLDADVFRVDIPSSADPITLDELRSARPGIRED